MPIADAGVVAHRLQSAGTPDRPQLIEFQWRYRGQEGRFSGDGAVRVNPPDSVRLDLLGPGWSGVQSAVLLEDDVYYMGEQRVELPPPAFMWAMIGAFRPPAGIEPQASSRGELTELAYPLSVRETIAYRFDGEGRLVEAELQVNGDVVQEIKIEHEEVGRSTGGYRWPREARFRDLGEYHEVRIRVVEIREHAPFESRIFRVADR